MTGSDAVKAFFAVSKILKLLKNLSAAVYMRHRPRRRCRMPILYSVCGSCVNSSVYCLSLQKPSAALYGHFCASSFRRNRSLTGRNSIGYRPNITKARTP